VIPFLAPGCLSARCNDVYFSLLAAISVHARLSPKRPNTLHYLCKEEKKTESFWEIFFLVKEGFTKKGEQCFFRRPA